MTEGNQVVIRSSSYDETDDSSNNIVSDHVLFSAQQEIGPLIQKHIPPLKKLDPGSSVSTRMSSHRGSGECTFKQLCGGFYESEDGAFLVCSICGYPQPIKEQHNYLKHRNYNSSCAVADTYASMTNSNSIITVFQAENTRLFENPLDLIEADSDSTSLYSPITNNDDKKEEKKMSKHKKENTDTRVKWDSDSNRVSSFRPLIGNLLSAFNAKILAFFGFLANINIIKCCYCSFQSTCLPVSQLLQLHYHTSPDCHYNPTSSNEDFFLFFHDFLTRILSFSRATTPETRKLEAASAGFAQNDATENFVCIDCGLEVESSELSDVETSLLIVHASRSENCRFIRRLSSRVNRRLRDSVADAIERSVFNVYVRAFSEIRSQRSPFMDIISEFMSGIFAQRVMRMGYTKEQVEETLVKYLLKNGETPPNTFKLTQALQETTIFEDIYPCEETPFTKKTPTCTICLTAPVSHVFTLCGHLCCCMNCAVRMTACPMCRKRVTAIMPFKSA